VTVGRYFTVESAAERYQPVLTARKLRRYILKREIEFTKLGNRVYLAESVLDALVERGRVPAMEPHPFLRGAAPAKARAVASDVITRGRVKSRRREG
jgi:hypothetical protein